MDTGRTNIEVARQLKRVLYLPAVICGITENRSSARIAEQEWTVLLMADPMTMSRLKAYRRNASAIEDIKAELSGKYVADSISVCTPPSYTPHSTRIDGFLPSGDTLSLLCEQARLEREQRAVEEFIKGIEDYQTRRMFVLKFIKGKTYLQIAMQVSGGRISEDAVEKKIKRYISKKS